MDEIEKKRIILQKAVDDSKSKLERNMLGQFATPRLLADELLEYARTQLPGNKVSFFDPAFGTGSFYTAFLKSFKGEIKGLGIEIDADYYKVAREVWKGVDSLEIENTDFTLADPKTHKQADLLVCNPPYSRHHHLSKDMKKRVNEKINKTLGIQVSGLAGLHFYFMLLCHEWMKQNGLAIWLVPSEILEVNYGKEIRKYLLNRVDLERIHFFEHSDVQFLDALVSSCVIVFRNDKPTTNKKIEITVGDFKEPTLRYKLARQKLDPEQKWSKHLLTKVETKPVSEEGAKLGDLFTVKRGIATGDNSYFILDKEKALQLEIPRKYLQNILPPSRYLKGDVVNPDEDGFLDVEKKLVVLNIDLSIDVIKREYPILYMYLQEGIAKGVNKGYLASKRSPWYSQEKRTSPKYFVRYMSRERKEQTDNHMIFIKNNSDAIAANSYLMLYKKPIDMFSSYQDDKKVWKLLSLGLNRSLYRFGRTYGGGLVKFEPSELKELPILV